MTGAGEQVPATPRRLDHGLDLGPASPSRMDARTPEAAVTLLYEAHALRLLRMAHLMLGDRAGAEDIVQEAFWGLYRRWGNLSDPDKALHYLRSSVLNACRSALRRRVTRRTHPAADPLSATRQSPVISAESAVLSAEERDQVMTAVRHLPIRQRQVLVLRFYLDLPDEEIAACMGIGRSTVRSATHRALASLARTLSQGES